MPPSIPVHSSVAHMGPAPMANDKGSVAGKDTALRGLVMTEAVPKAKALSSFIHAFSDLD